MTKNARLSIITPCRSSDFLAITALAWSLIKQTYNHFEWVIVGQDLSPLKKRFKHDKVLNKAIQSADIPINFINNTAQNTVGEARDVGMHRAVGDWCVFVDADDYLRLNALKDLDWSLAHNNGDNHVYDLTPYITYEPYSSFQSAMKASPSGDDPLPAWGGSKATDPNRLNQKYLHYTVTSRPSSLMSNHAGIDYAIKYLRANMPSLKHELSCLNIDGKVVSKSEITRYRLTFDTHVKYYSSYMFMLDALRISSLKPVQRPQHIYGHIKALDLKSSKMHYIKHSYQPMNDYFYIKVRHNDPVNNPSLSQTHDSKRWIIWARAVSRAYKHLSKYRDAKRTFANFVLVYLSTYLCKDVVNHHVLSRNVYKDTMATSIQHISKCLQQIDEDCPQLWRKVPLRSVDKHALETIENDDYDSVYQAMEHLYKVRVWHQIIRQHGRGITRWEYFHHYLSQPLNDNVIMYSSFLGRNYSDSPKYVYRYIYKHYPKEFTHVWVADADHYDQIKQDLAGMKYTKVVKRWGFRYMKYLATARFFVNNMRQPKWFIKRPGMRYIETWHGTPLKTLVFDMKYVASASHLYKAVFFHQSRQWDHLVADNPFSYQHFSRAFRYPQAKILKSGYPRNDILYHPSEAQEVADRVRAKLHIPLDKKVILYAPTWRDDQVISAGHYRFTLHLDLDLLKKNLGDDYVVLLRTHYFIANHLKTSQYGAFVRDVSDYDDISQLYLISDILITDYSSVFFDYANLKRPILFYVYDYDTYAKVLHGFYLNMKTELPGPLLKTNQGILSAIKNIKQIEKEYASRYKRFNQRFNCWDDGHASERVAKELLKL